MKSDPAKKITGQCFSAEMKTTGKNSADLEQKKKFVTYPLLSLASSHVVMLEFSNLLERFDGCML